MRASSAQLLVRLQLENPKRLDIAAGKELTVLGITNII
jgi:hypothetical protein